jgi:hypothetical protein
VGSYDGGKQFMAFVSGTFAVDRQHEPKRWIAVLHLFDADGNHVTTQTRLGGFDAEGRKIAVEKAWIEMEDLIADIVGVDIEFHDISIKLFSVEVDGVTHGLLYETGERSGEWVMLEPLDVMFHPPWDSGKFST